MTLMLRYFEVDTAKCILIQNTLVLMNGPNIKMTWGWVEWQIHDKYKYIQKIKVEVIHWLYKHLL